MATKKDDWRKQLIHDLKIVANGVMRDIMDLNEQKIEKIIYKSYNPSKYERSHEFSKAWSKDKAHKEKSNSVQCTMYYDGDKMSVGWPSTDPESPEYGKHASAIDNFDAREYLADIIYQGLAGPAFGHGVQTGPWAEARDVWAELEKTLDNGKFEKLVEKHMKKVGLDFKKI